MNERFAVVMVRIALICARVFVVLPLGHHPVLNAYVPGRSPKRVVLNSVELGDNYLSRCRNLGMCYVWFLINLECICSDAFYEASSEPRSMSV